ncbi:hypothetical protein [Nocardia acidivorans]|uniref:hypothetical protein n=1 Tax=Nocardia acidivorans TaxID=404580 RepID=UPI001C3F8E20|nr:hypothetical protein [Nocardia acidivorans]
MVLLGGAGLLISTAGAGSAVPDSGLGGCYRGSVLTAQRVPGTGSAGQSVRRTAQVWDCVSPLLPGIGSGRFDAELPWNGGGSITSGTFTWSDGSVSGVTGLPNTLWEITSGPGSGHTVQFQLDMPMNGDWYYTDNSMAIVAATFLR